MEYRGRDATQRPLPPALQPGYRNASHEVGPATNAASRAEIFEDEKKRIMSSCFSRVDEKGNLLTSYITHVRVVEDAMSPQEPPPLNSPSSNRKPRVIIVAVKNSGRVFMYKARENDNGQFQIGKEWDLDQLQRIESFAHATPITIADRQRAERAGTTGFIVVMTKPYYWQANTTKEKDFFLASLVKIFRKYTQGRVPELVGFDEKEEEIILRVPGASGQPQSGSGTPTAVGWSPKVPSGHQLALDQQSIASSVSSRQPMSTTQDRRYDGYQDEMNSHGQNGRTSNDRYTSHQRGPSDQERSRNMTPDSVRPGRSQTPRNQADPTLKTQISHSDFVRPRSKSPSRSVKSSLAPSFGSRDLDNDPAQKPMTSTTLNMDQKPLSRVISNNGPEKWNYNNNGAYLQNSRNGSEAMAREPSLPPAQALPERRRPPLEEEEDVAHPLPLNAAQVLRDRWKKRAESPSPATSQDTEVNTAESELRQDVSTTRSLSNRGAITTPDTNKTDAGSIDNENIAPGEITRSTTVESLDTQQRTDEVSSPTESLASPEEQTYRPGLGPMIKKKDVAGKFRKAATAYTAFQPRAGSALNKALVNKTKDIQGPDGITSVVPAPLLHRDYSQDSVSTAKSETPTAPKVVPPSNEAEVPEVSVSSPGGQTKSPGISQISHGNSVEPPKPLTPTKQTSETGGEKEVPVIPPRVPRTKKRKSDLYTKGLMALKIDPIIFGTRGIDFDSLLVDAGWDDTISRSRKVETLEADLRKELIKTEAGAWIGSFDQKDERIELVEKMLDKAIAECDQLDGLLTLYGVELGSLNDDVAYIEAQSQGLQVQTANQKLLHTELKKLVDTISISPREMEPLRQATLGDLDGLEAIETCLQHLYRALNLRGSKAIHHADTDLSSMRALQDKKEMYMRETSQFLNRMQKYMDPTFGQAAMQAKDALGRPKGGIMKTNVSAHDAGRKMLWKFSPLMLFAKEVDIEIWEGLMRTYQNRIRTVYQDEFRELVLTWKSKAKKPTGEELEPLFVTQEKEPEGLTSTARKLTVKRSQTIVRSFRNPSIDKTGSLHRGHDIQCPAWESFSRVLEGMVPLITTEQNFVIDFFHASSVENQDFDDALMAAPPSKREGTNLHVKRAPDPDREISRRVNEAVEDIFGYWSQEMKNLLEWVVKQDVTQSLALLCVLETKIAEIEDTNQEYLTRSLQQLRERVAVLFVRFIDDQIRAIEETKVKIKKRKGVIAFIRVFPLFSTILENTVQPYEGPEKVAIRNRLDDAYEKVNKTMFDSLKFIAKESPTVMLQNTGQSYALSGGADPEDKEALNYHILLLENMFHYYTEVDERGSEVLGKWRGQAVREMEEHQELYVNAIIRRPLGKLLDFIEGVEALMTTHPGSQNPTSIPTTSPSQSLSVFKKVLSSHDAREIKKGIERLRERVEKHFSAADEAAISDKLIGVVLKDCERKYNAALDRLQHISKEVYEDALEIEFRKEDVAGGFRLSPKYMP